MPDAFDLEPRGPAVSRFIRHKKKDANHGYLVKFFRACGALVDDVSDLSGLGYDIIVCYAGETVMVEIKDGSKPPSQRRLTESEEAAKARWGKKFAVIEDEEQAKGLLDSMARYSGSAV